MSRRPVDVAVIIPDASPVLTLARIGRLDLFDTFSAPIQIVDQVRYEITKPTNDPDGMVAA
jgi:predicted nucleic acid-binding protein